MTNYWKALTAYHKRYLALYLLVGGAIYLFYYMQWPTPLSLILEPLGRRSWGAGMTRASIKLLQGDWQAAWSYNPRFFLVMVLAAIQLFIMPLIDKKRTSYARKTDLS